MIAADAVLGTIGLAALVAPGWLLARAHRMPLPLLAGFIGGSVALVTLILTWEAAGVPLRLTTFAPAWAAIVVAAAWVHWRAARTDPAAPAPPEHRAPFGREHWALLLPLLPAFAVVAYRAIAQPLSGIDTIFRWNYLAEAMLSHGTLGFYPPVTAEDFAIYAWPDGIAPVVSGLYFWLYAIAGAARPELTAPLVIFQYALIMLAARALARRMFSESAAAYTSALLAGLPIVAWATVMGQETGLTAIAFTALLLYLPRSRREETAAMWVCAGLAAGFGALVREYGLALPLIGLAICGARRLSLRGTLGFTGIVLLTALPWYARNWVHTGNPLYSLALGGLFPVNPVHAWLNESIRADFGWSHLPAEAPRLILTNALAALLGIIGSVIFFRQARAVVGTAVVVAVLWATSIPYTAAGFISTLRVLSPAFVLGAVLGGAALARWVPAQRLQRSVALALTILALDAALRALTMPANVYRVPWTAWLTVGGAVQEFHERSTYRELAAVAGTNRMLVLGPNALLTRQGARTVPLWSPEVRFLFDEKLPPDEIARRLQAAQITFVLLNTGPVNERFLAHSHFFREPAGTLQPVWHDSDTVLLRVVSAKK